MIFVRAEWLFDEGGNSLPGGDEVRDHDTDRNRPDSKVVEDAPGEDKILLKGGYGLSSARLL